MELKVTADVTAKEDIKKAIQEDILEFEKWFRAHIEDTNLHPIESSILRTYLNWKMIKE